MIGNPVRYLIFKGGNVYNTDNVINKLTALLRVEMQFDKAYNLIWSVSLIYLVTSSLCLLGSIDTNECLEGKPP